MEWIGWAFAAVAAVLLTVFIFLYLHQKQQAQHQHKKDQKAQAKLQTEMSRMQKELYHERDIIGLIQEHMVEGILILDDSDKIQLANRTATALLSIEKENWDNKSIFILTDNQAFLDALRKSKTEPQHDMPPADDDLHKGCTVRQLLKIDGSYIRAYITRVEMGGIFGTIVLLVDVTYNVKAEKMRQEFTANVSHELKTPLTTIKGFGEMFGSGMITKEDDVAKYGAMIERESERLLFLINDIIRLSEIEEHTEMLNTPVDLAAAAGNALQILEPQIQRNRIQVHLEADVSCCTATKAICGSFSSTSSTTPSSTTIPAAQSPSPSNTWVHRQRSSLRTTASAFRSRRRAASSNGSTGWTKAGRNSVAAPGWGCPSSSTS